MCVFTSHVGVGGAPSLPPLSPTSQECELCQASSVLQWLVQLSRLAAHGPGVLGRSVLERTVGGFSRASSVGLLCGSGILCPHASLSLDFHVSVFLCFHFLLSCVLGSRVPMFPVFLCSHAFRLLCLWVPVSWVPMSPCFHVPAAPMSLRFLLPPTLSRAQTWAFRIWSNNGGISGQRAASRVL